MVHVTFIISCPSCWTFCRWMYEWSNSLGTLYKQPSTVLTIVWYWRLVCFHWRSSEKTRFYSVIFERKPSCSRLNWAAYLKSILAKTSRTIVGYFEWSHINYEITVNSIYKAWSFNVDHDLLGRCSVVNQKKCSFFSATTQKTYKPFLYIFPDSYSGRSIFKTEL